MEVDVLGIKGRGKTRSALRLLLSNGSVFEGARERTLAGSRGRWAALTVGVVGVAAGIRRALDGLATRLGRKALNRAEGMSGSLGRVHVGLLPPAIRIEGVHIVQSAGDGSRAQLSCPRAELRLRLLPVLRGRMAARLCIDRSIVTLDRERDEKAPVQDASGEQAQSSLMTINPQSMMAQLPPLAVDPIRVRQAELLYRESGPERRGSLRIHGVQVIVRGLATRPELAGGGPVHLSAHGHVGRRGRFALSIDANPQASRLTFRGRAELREFVLRELDDFIGPKTDLRIPEGTVDLFVVFSCRDGKLQGGVEPVLKDVSIEAADRSWLDHIKAWLTDKTIELISGDVEGHKTVATVIPIVGTLDSPDIKLMPAILGVIRNAFVIGLRGGFESMPSEMAAAREGFFKQTKHALSRSGGRAKVRPPKEKHP